MSLVLTVSVLLRWPDLFLFSKIVYLPEWVGFFPNPLFAAWLLLLGPLALALPGSARFSAALGRLAALAFLGPCTGVIVQSILWSLDLENAVIQMVWVSVICVLPPTAALAGAAAVRAWLARRHSESA